MNDLLRRSPFRTLIAPVTLLFVSLCFVGCSDERAATDAELSSGLSGVLPSSSAQAPNGSSGSGSTTHDGAVRPALPTAADLAGDSRSVASTDQTSRQFFATRQTDLPVPGRTAANETISTDDGRLSHRRGARLYRAGDVTEGDLLSFNARLTNSGSAPLRIENIEGECECIEALCFRLDGDRRGAPLVPGQDVAPGEDFEIQVHLDTTDRFGQLQLEGLLEYRGAKAPLKFGVLTNIRPVYVIEPAEAFVPKNVLLGHAHEVEARITSPVAPWFKLVLDKKRLPPHLRLEIEPLEPNEEGYARAWRAHFKVLASAPDAAGLQTSPVVFEVIAAPSPGEELPFSMLRTVSVGHRSRLPVEALQIGGQGGAILDFGRMKPGETVERRLRLRVNDSEFALPAELPVVPRGAYTIGARVLEASAVAAHSETHTSGAREVVATFTAPTDAQGPVRGQLVVEIGHPRQSSVLVTFTALVR